MVDAKPDDEHAMVKRLRVAQELPWVGDAAIIELHSVGVDTNRNGPILQEPLGHLCLVGRHCHSSSDHGSHHALVEVTLFIVTLVLVVLF